MRQLRTEMQELLALVSKPMTSPVLQPHEATRLGSAPVQPIREAPSLRVETDTSDAAIARLFEDPILFPD